MARMARSPGCVTRVLVGGPGSGCFRPCGPVVGTCRWRRPRGVGRTWMGDPPCARLWMCVALMCVDGTMSLHDEWGEAWEARRRGVASCTSKTACIEDVGRGRLGYRAAPPQPCGYAGCRRRDSYCWRCCFSAFSLSATNRRGSVNAMCIILLLIYLSSCYNRISVGYSPPYLSLAQNKF
ncbi:hypothetical protein C8J57DRAFT_1307669 [Mycena rebaudengoi]|nr:hypothetical protein C8J57DRAFT_1307669 [Mycena rebaudengoi]